MILLFFAISQYFGVILRGRLFDRVRLLDKRYYWEWAIIRSFTVFFGW